MLEMLSPNNTRIVVLHTYADAYTNPLFHVQRLCRKREKLLFPIKVSGFIGSLQFNEIKITSPILINGDARNPYLSH